MAKDKYEISLWEDIIVPATDSIPEHYEERKIAIIGSDSITAYCRAIEPNLIENINGTNTFTFKMVYKCHNGSIDDLKYQFQVRPAQEGGENEKLLDSNTLQLIWEDLFFQDGEYENPFIDLLVNERKIKVLWKNKWYDFVIKNYQKDSNGRTITFTCKDLFINELSKNGYDLDFNTELENNQGTVLELAEKVLEGTDWQLDTEGSDIIQQEKEEPVYEATTVSSFEADDQTESETITIPQDKLILVFYSDIQEIVDQFEGNNTNSGSTEIQFLYAPAYVRDQGTQLVINGSCCATSVDWTIIKDSRTGSHSIIFKSNDTTLFTVYYEGGVSSEYRAKKLIRSIQSILDPLTDKYVNIYRATADGTGGFAGLFSAGDIIYSYRDTFFTDPTAVGNLVVNGADFKILEGWLSTSEDLYFTLYPKYTSVYSIDSYVARSYLKVIGGQRYCNTGITDLSYLLPDGFRQGDRYILRAKIKRNQVVEGQDSPSDTYFRNFELNPMICEYSYENEWLVFGKNYFNVTNTTINDDWIEYDMRCIESVTRAHLYLYKLGITLTPTAGIGPLWLEELQFFPYTEGRNAEGEIVRIDPKDLNVQSVATIRYNYYNHTTNQDLTSKDELAYIWSGAEDILNNVPFEAVYNDDFAKIRSISINKSNRYNILQTLAETFECWVEPYIEHTETGAFVYDDDVPRKFIRFKKERGVETGVGFIYGIDLQTVSKTVQSDQIVTKTIVSNNNNQYAERGFCSIARSKENYPRVNFLLNFDYYVNQGMIDGGALYRDLYLSTSNSIGYYYWLHKLNLEYDKITEELTAKKLEYDKQLSYQVLYTNLIIANNQQISSIKESLMQIASVTSWPAATQYIQVNADQVEIQTRVISLQSLTNVASEYEQTLDSVNAAVEELENIIAEGTERQEAIIEQIKDLDFRFYKKYSRYIQEGTWIDENYIDDDLYYLDAQSVAYTSAFPQVSYNVSVLRLSSLEEFKNKVFNVGDIAYIEDTDFFGYVYIDGVKTPYKEKVLISEVSSFFDEPSKDTFKIQNYKTQFEDLFQRITAATQSLKYNEGGYGKVASIINADGTIKAQTLQQSVNGATTLMYSATNNTITQDSTGLTVVDFANPNRMTKITSGGVFISTDGGVTWYNTISAEGVATEQLTAGNINTSSINVLDGNFPTFRWDSKGISAFEVNDLGVNFNKFVRYDHYGIYGIDGIANYVPKSEDEIWRDATYGLTWKGFFLKSNYTNGYVSISSDNDFQVVQKINGQEIERIKIGAIEFTGDGYPTKYGINIRNEEGDVVFDTGSDGNITITGIINAAGGQIGSITVLDDRLVMDKIVFRPGVGIYAEKPYVEPEDPINVNERSTVGSMVVGDGVVSTDFPISSVGDMVAGEGVVGIEPPEERIDPVFIISDVDGSAIFNQVTARGTIYAEDGELGDLQVIGVLTVGNILPDPPVEGEVGASVIIDGNTGIIKSSNYDSENNIGWTINYDGTASFYDIYALGGTLGGLTVVDELVVGAQGANGLIRSFAEDNSENPLWIISQDGSAIFRNISALGGSLGDLGVDGLLTVGSQDNTTILINGNNGTISSSNYSSGNSGWQIESSGEAEFNEVTVRGTIYAEDGEFNGTVYATDGEFTGTIYADSGTLSGLNVNGILTVGDVNNSNITIDGSTNNASIYSSNYSDVNETGWKINYDGSAKFYSIEALGGTLGALNVIDELVVGAQGAQGTIQSYNYQDGAGLGWRIDSDGDAIFNNITARGAIKTAVFEYAEIQAVGGVFLFRPSSTIRSVEIDGNNLKVTVEKPLLFKVNKWCKVSNYTADGEAENPDATSILVNNGLTHVYKIINITNGVITLQGAAVMVTGQDAVTTIEKLVGGALVDMGLENGTANYGIGINSSDNTVNLPARAISLFETNINPNSNVKVTYNYRGILGTLPAISSLNSNSIYHNYLEGTQGIFTDNMYIGDNDQYLAFYTDGQDNKHLTIKATSLAFEVIDPETGEPDWKDVADIEEGAAAVQVVVESNVGNMFLNSYTEATLTCHVYRGTDEITNQVTQFTWSKRDKNGTIDTSWIRPSQQSVDIDSEDIDAKAIFTCEVEF